MVFKKGQRSEKKGKSYEELYGIKKAREIKRKQSETVKRLYDEGKSFTKEHRKNIGLARIGMKFSEEHKKNLRLNAKNNPNANMKGKHQPKEAKEKIRKIMYEFWKNKENKEKRIKAVLKTLRKRPTSYEKKIIDLCGKYNLPFRYVGDGKVIIGCKNPDFVENNGEKLIIETYSKHWHPKDYVKKRMEIFAKYGYKTLFLNDEDLFWNENWEEICLNKIIKFTENLK